MDAFRVEFTGNMVDFHSRMESKILELEAKVEREMSESRAKFQKAIAQLGRELAELQGALAKHLFLLQSLCQQTGFGISLLRYCRNVRPTWVKFNSKDTKESEWCARF